MQWMCAYNKILLLLKLKCLIRTFKIQGEVKIEERSYIIDLAYLYIQLKRNVF